MNAGNLQRRSSRFRNLPPSERFVARNLNGFVFVCAKWILPPTRKPVDICRFLTIATGLSLGLGAAACGGASGPDGPIESEIDYEESEERVVVDFNRSLADQEQLHARIRSLAEGESLNCEQMASDIPRREDQIGERRYAGPEAEPEMFESPMDTEALVSHSREGYQERLKETYFVEICVTGGGGVAHEARYSLQQALDESGDPGVNGKFDAADDGVEIESQRAYAEACVREMGEIPFWGEPIGDGEEMDWGTVDCNEVGTPIGTTVDGEPQDSWVDKCDRPQFIYSHCEADARTGANGPRVAHSKNDEGTHWVLLCRKAHKDKDAEAGRYNDMAMIGHNPFSGKTCFLQNQLPRTQSNRSSNNGREIPHPADDVSSEESPKTSSDLWDTTVHGGIGDGIECQGCHSNDPFIHTPWIDQAKDENGDTIVPKMGEHPDFAKGSNGPYRLLDQKDQGWEQPRRLVSEEAAPCTKCHRMTDGQWAKGGYGGSRWLDRLVGDDRAWNGVLTESHKDFEDVHWMPPDSHADLDAEEWSDSKYKEALDFIRSCGDDPDQEECDWKPLPDAPGDGAEVPEVDLEGKELAKEALAALGAPYEASDASHEGTRRCAECHATSRVGFRNWLQRTDEAIERGIDPRKDLESVEESEARALVDYMKRDGPESPYSAYKIGILAPGVQYPYFQELFEKAYGTDWAREYSRFKQRVGMPKGSHEPLTAREFAVVLKWFADADLAHMDDLLPGRPPPDSCETVRERFNLSDGPAPWLGDHIEQMKFDGWQARNRERGIRMYGCSGDSTLECFSSDEYSERESWIHGDTPSGTRAVSVYDLGFSTSYWLRSSADGRFTAIGGSGVDGYGATLTDLRSGEDIGVEGSYDPGFFPNNDGFIMQGGGAGLCGRSVLTDDELTEDGIDFSEPGCTTADGINLYQHVAVDPSGGDYFVINSEFTSDPGGASSDPSAPFNEGSTMKFTPLVFDGSSWQQKDSVVVDAPYEGDSVLSPSGEMVMSRFAGPDGDALGYMLRRVQAEPQGDGYDIGIRPAVQFLCEPGAKPNISYDERYMTTHHYENGTSNIYVSDLLTGESYQVTDMPEDVEALFPHFRSDGWIYFLANGSDGERVVATDVAVRLQSDQ